MSNAILAQCSTEQLKAALTALYNRKGKDSITPFRIGCDLLEERIGEEGLDAFFDELDAGA